MNPADMRCLLATSLIALLASLAFAAAPASAVETGVNETMHQNLPVGKTASDLGADWVRIWGTWHDLEPNEGAYNEPMIHDFNAKVADARARGVNVLMVIVRAPGWATGGTLTAPPRSPAKFGRFMGEMARRMPAVQAWEMWNEQDGAEFFGGGPDPAHYAAMVKAAYPAIKAVQPNDTVVSGGMIGNNMDYLAELYKHGAQGSFDAVGVHTDTACLVDGPDVMYRDEKGRIGQYSFTGYREVHAVMSANGDGAKPIWMTELGWNTQSTAPNSCSTGKWKGTKPLGVSEAQQAEFLTRAYRCLAADPFVQTALWFGFQDIPGSAHAGGYGLYRSDTSAKPAAAAFRALDGGIPAERCGGVIDTSGPTIEVAKPLDGAKFVDVLPIDAKAVDSAGGVGIRRIEIWADGKFEYSFGDGHAKMRSFWPVADWKRGKHTLTFKAEDEAGNKSSKSIAVHKVRRLPKVKTAATLTLEQLDPQTVRVTGGVSSVKARAAAKLRGKAFVVFQKRVTNAKGKLKWRAKHRIGRRASRPVDVTQALEPGKWRVFLRYAPRKGFKKSRSKPVGFRIAPPA
jgi:Cellulase (glycosyl hydrolase family 5)